MNPTHDSVQFSRTQGIFSAAALGGSIVLAISIFIAGAHLIRLSGNDAPLVLVIAALLFLPIILSCVQRSAGAVASASFYNAAKATGSAIRLFFTVWLMLGGYLAVGAVLAYGAATRLSLGLERVFGLDVGIELITVLLIAAAFVKEVLTEGQGSWRSRTVIFWVCSVFLILLVIWAAVTHYHSGGTIPKREPIQHWLLAVSILASSLWSIDVVLNYRGQFRNPNRTVTWSLIVIFCGGNTLAALTAIAILMNPSLLMQNWLAALTWTENRLELLLLIAGLLICFSGLLRVITRITRLLGAMMMDGALPSSSTQLPGSKALYYSAFCITLLAYLAVSIPISYLLLISAFTALLTLVLYLHPLLKKDLSRITPLKLPIHPLMPVLSIILAIFLMWILPIENLFIGGLWLIAGAVLYWTIARKKMLPALQQKVLTAEGVQPSAPRYRVLACLNPGQINKSLIRIGAALAAANNGELLVLRILETSELLPAELQRNQGEEEWNRIKAALDEIQLPHLNAVPVVRLAPDFISGIKATAREFAVDFELLEWPKESAERLRKNQLQNLLQLTANPLGILNGQISEKLHSVSVACGSSSHSIFALQSGEALASINESTMEAIKVYSKGESRDDAVNGIRSMIQQSGVRFPAQIVIHEEIDIEEGIVKEAESSDLLLLGASDDPLSGRPLPDGQAVEIALQRKQATLILKAKEEASIFLMRRVLAALTKHVTILTLKERAELLGQLKVGLQASTDFYLMVALAAAIAITGLIMNDGSIVLGAMLVSPLMGPIVGIACGIALGNLDLMRRSSASTFKGMGLVLGMGIVMTFILPSVQPTDQILSRTHPGIFDLLAALAAGAAGAYSLGRKSVAGAIPGVAMSLSLEPPLATAGYGISTSQFWITGGAFLLFLTNLAAIVLSGVAVYLLLGMRPPRKEGLYVVGKAIASVILIVFVLVVPLGFGTYGALQKGHLKFQIESQFRSAALEERFQLLDLKISENEKGFLINPTVLASEEVTPEKMEKFREAIEEKIGSPIQIDATILQTKRIESPTQNVRD